jgi:hypothetical protein
MVMIDAMDERWSKAAKPTFVVIKKGRRRERSASEDGRFQMLETLTGNSLRFNSQDL